MNARHLAALSGLAALLACATGAPGSDLFPALGAADRSRAAVAEQDPRLATSVELFAERVVHAELCGWNEMRAEPVFSQRLAALPDRALQRLARTQFGAEQELHRQMFARDRAAFPNKAAADAIMCQQASREAIAGVLDDW